MKKGFTLAEILITLAIVGVVASMTIPTLVTSNQKKVWANSLAKAANTIGNSLSLMISRDGSYGLSDSSLWEDVANGGDLKDALVEHLGEVMVITDGTYNVVPKTLYNVEKSTLFDDYTMITTKAGITYFIKIAEDSYNIHDMQWTDMVADVIIDVNGEEAPNTIGKDIFGYLISDEGRLLPYGETGGGSIHGDLYSTSAGNSNRYGTTWSVKCPDSSKADSGFCCTARVVAEGYKINY